jgi:hypothetical protein
MEGRKMGGDTEKERKEKDYGISLPGRIVAMLCACPNVI